MSELSPVFMADLDDTLFQTLRKCPPNVAHGDLTEASWTDDGGPSGYQTPMQRRLHGWMREGQVIPVTARSLEVTRRTIADPGGRAICANGGLILGPDGQRDEEWHGHLRNQAAEGGDVADAYERIMPVLAEYGDHLRHWTVVEGDLPLYIVIKHNDLTDADLLTAGRTARSALSDDWHTHSNGNNFAILPKWLGKRHAAIRVIGQLRQEQPDRPIIGIGDSRTDGAYMLECDYAMTPTNSQIAAVIGSMTA